MSACVGKVGFCPHPGNTGSGELWFFAPQPQTVVPAVLLMVCPFLVPKIKEMLIFLL